MQSPSAGISHKRETICTPAGGALLFCEEKEPKVIQGCALKTLRTGTPARNGYAVPERGLNGAYKVSQMHLPPPNLPRFGGGERPPFSCKPIAPLTITMGRRLIFRPIIVPHPNHRDPPPLQALTPRECYSRFIVASPSGPLSRHRERGWGERADALRLPWERFCAQYGLILGCRQKSIRIQHSQRQGSWGSAPSVFC